MLRCCSCQLQIDQLLRADPEHDQAIPDHQVSRGELTSLDRLAHLLDLLILEGPHPSGIGRGLSVPPQLGQLLGPASASFLPDTAGPVVGHLPGPAAHWPAPQVGVQEGGIVRPAALPCRSHQPGQIRGQQRCQVREAICSPTSRSCSCWISRSRCSGCKCPGSLPAGVAVGSGQSQLPACI